MNLRRSFVTIAIPALLASASLPVLSDAIPPGYRELTPEEAVNIQKALEQSLTAKPAETSGKTTSPTQPDSTTEPSREQAPAAEGTQKEAPSKATAATAPAKTEKGTDQSPSAPASAQNSREELLKSMEARRLALQKRREERLKKLEAERKRRHQEALKRWQQMEQEMQARREAMLREEREWMKAMEARRPNLPPQPPAGYGGERWYPAYPDADLPPAHGAYPPPAPGWQAPRGYYPRW